MKKLTTAFATTANGEHFIKIKYSGILPIIIITDGIDLHYLNKCKTPYLKLEDVIKWHEREFEFSKDEKYKKYLKILKEYKEKLINNEIPYS